MLKVSTKYYNEMLNMLKLITITVAVVTSISSSHALAQGLEEVIVTATKRAESLQDVPVTVNTLSEMTIQEAGITDLSDVAALVPALTVSTPLCPSLLLCEFEALAPHRMTRHWKLPWPSYWLAFTWGAQVWACQT